MSVGNDRMVMMFSLHYSGLVQLIANSARREYSTSAGKCRSVVQGGPERSWSTKGVVVPVVHLVHSDPL